MDASTVVNDYCKTVITLASALLVFTGAYLDPAKQLTILITIAWTLLVLAIASGLFALGRLAASLQAAAASTGAQPSLKLSGRFGNLAWAFFVLAVIFFVWHVREIRRAPPPPLFPTSSVFALLTKLDATDFAAPQLQSYRYETATKTWSVVAKGAKSLVIVEVDIRGSVISLARTAHTL